MRMYKSISSIVALVVLTTLGACSAAKVADLMTLERVRLGKDSLFLSDMSHRYLDPTNPWNQSEDPHYWIVVGHVIASIDAIRENIIGYALKGYESELKNAFNSAESIAKHQLESLRAIEKMGGMKSTRLSEDIKALEKLISRQPGQV